MSAESRWRYWCPICNIEFPDHASLRSHYEQSHEDKVKWNDYVRAFVEPQLRDLIARALASLGEEAPSAGEAVREVEEGLEQARELRGLIRGLSEVYELRERVDRLEQAITRLTEAIDKINRALQAPMAAAAGDGEERPAMVVSIPIRELDYKSGEFTASVRVPLEVIHHYTLFKAFYRQEKGKDFPGNIGDFILIATERLLESLGIKPLVLRYTPVRYIVVSGGEEEGE